MACFPKIDQPCPLGIDEQKRIDGYCGRCAKTVHALDALDQNQRRSLLREAQGPICVSWRRPAARGLGVGLGAALAVSMSASAFAIEGLPGGNAVEPMQSPAATSAPSLLGDEAKGPECDEKAHAAAPEPPPMEMMVMVGGVSDPGNAEWVDDSDLPDLPMVSAPADR